MCMHAVSVISTLSREEGNSFLGFSVFFEYFCEVYTLVVSTFFILLMLMATERIYF